MSLKDYLVDMDRAERQAFLLLEKKITEAKMECLGAMKPTPPYNDSKLRTQIDSLEKRMENLRVAMDAISHRRDRLELMEVRLNQGIKRVELYESRLNGIEGYLSRFTHVVLHHLESKLTPADGKSLLKFMRVQDTNQEKSIAAGEAFIATLTKELQENERLLEELKRKQEKAEEELEASEQRLADFKKSLGEDHNKARALDLIIYLEKHPEARKELGWDK